MDQELPIGQSAEWIGREIGVIFRSSLHQMLDSVVFNFNGNLAFLTVGNLTCDIHESDAVVAKKEIRSGVDVAAHEKSSIVQLV